MKQIRLALRCAVVFSLFVSIVALSNSTMASSGSNWAQFRGPDGQGISSDKNLPTEWSDTKNVQWKTAIEGRGHSCPIIWGNRLFVTTSIEGETLPDAKPFVHMLQGREFKHPDWVARVAG